MFQAESDRPEWQRQRTTKTTKNIIWLIRRKSLILLNGERRLLNLRSEDGQTNTCSQCLKREAREISTHTNSPVHIKCLINKMLWSVYFDVDGALNCVNYTRQKLFVCVMFFSLAPLYVIKFISSTHCFISFFVCLQRRRWRRFYCRLVFLRC